MMNEHTAAFLSALAGTESIYDFRALHDTDKGKRPLLFRGKITDVVGQLEQANGAGFGIHVVINETDGAGLSASNIKLIRAQLLDLDAIDAAQQLANVNACPVPPHMTVHTSPGKTQNWFLTTRHADRQLFIDNQRRLIAAFNGDPQFVDAAHTARLPGFYHLKANPHFVTLAAGPAWGKPVYDPWQIAAPFLGIQLNTGNTERKPLGMPEWSAPSLDWLAYALNQIDPNALGRSEWIALTAATKQAGWTLNPEKTWQIWCDWCARYHANNTAENTKQWNSIEATSAGWGFIVRRSNIGGDLIAAGLPIGTTTPTAQIGATVTTIPDASSTAAAAQVQGEFLNAYDQSQYFAGCFWVTALGRIFGPNGRLMDATRFNGHYGGKMFMLDEVGKKTTDEPWKAALRGRTFNIPKVDHIRFLPALPFGATVKDEFGSDGVNTYRPPIPTAKPGDVTPFMRHVELLFPQQSDRDILFAYMAQCVQRPGVKIKWAVVIQSMEGAGKSIFQQIMESALGQSYTYAPSAKELTEGGGKFNGWMRNKLMIIINEVKTDEKRELVEVFKTWISEYRIEMQNKGLDADMGDNPTNFLMFTNYKDAIPISDKSRRYAILYSAIQELNDLKQRGMDGQYFSNLYQWSANGGAEAVCDWLLKYPVPAALDAQLMATRAPATTSTDEAIANSRSWLEQLIFEAVADDLQGFRGGFISTAAVSRVLRDNGKSSIGGRSVSAALNALGYHFIGKAPKVYLQEFVPYQTRVYSRDPAASPYDYGKAQGFEP